MSNLELRIGGKPYQIACAPGDEPHVLKLGSMIDDKLADLGASAAGQSDTRQLLMASLMLADELHELRKAQGGSLGTHAPHASDEDYAKLAEKLERIAERLEHSLAAS